MEHEPIVKELVVRLNFGSKNKRSQGSICLVGGHKELFNLANVSRNHKQYTGVFHFALISLSAFAMESLEESQKTCYLSYLFARLSTSDVVDSSFYFSPR